MAGKNVEVLSIAEMIRELRSLRTENRRISIENQSLLERAEIAEKQVRTDYLTGVLSQFGLYEILDEIMEDSVKEGYPLSTSFIDLDKFKELNTVYGYSTADRVLQEFATSLAENSRATDVSRWAGDEYVVFFPYTEVQNTVPFFQRAGKDLDKRLRENLNLQHNVNFTSGVIQYDPSVHANSTELVGAASDVLREGKESGRGKVYLSINDNVEGYDISQ